MTTARASSIRDVAVLAGVSVGTVSNVLNGSPRVSPGALELVVQAYGYRTRRVEIVDADPGWPGQFRALREILVPALGDVGLIGDNAGTPGSFVLYSFDHDFRLSGTAPLTVVPELAGAADAATVSGSRPRSRC